MNTIFNFLLTSITIEIIRTIEVFEPPFSPSRSRFGGAR
jgi:hypothetical protein